MASSMKEAIQKALASPKAGAFMKELRAKAVQLRAKAARDCQQTVSPALRRKRTQENRAYMPAKVNHAHSTGRPMSFGARRKLLKKSKRRIEIEDVTRDNY